MPKIPMRGKRTRIITNPSSVKKKRVWIDGEITLSLKEGKRRIKAKLYGPLAIHKEIVSRVNWVVTVVSCGRFVAEVEEERHAYRIAEILLDECPKALSYKSKEDIQEWMPDWVVQWIYKCYEEKAFVKTKPFRDED